MHVQELFKLEGKTALVTGGGRGLGAQMAEALAEAGANVVVCSRKTEACQEMSNRLKEKGVKSLALKCDITNADDVQNVVAGPLSSLVPLIS